MVLFVHAARTISIGPVPFARSGRIFRLCPERVYWTAAALEQAGRPVHIVAPYDDTKFGMWSDGKTVQMFTRVLKDVMPQVERHLVVEKRIIQGFSMGGFGTMLLGLRHPELFSRILVWDGALHSWETLTPFIAKGQFGNSVSIFEENSPWKAAEACPDKAVPILIFVGRMQATLAYGRRFYKHLQDSGMQRVTFLETDLPHCLQPFVEHHGHRAIAFLFSEVDEVTK